MNELEWLGRGKYRNHGIAPDGSRWLTVKEACGLIGVTAKAFRQITHEGKLDLYNPSEDRYLVSERDCLIYLRDRKVGPPQPPVKRRVRWMPGVEQPQPIGDPQPHSPS